MGAGRIVSGALATITVAGCALLVVGMTRAGADRQAAGGTAVSSTPRSQPSTSIPAQLPVAARTSAGSRPASSSSRPSASRRPPVATTHPAATSTHAAPPSAHAAQPAPVAHPVSTRPASRPTTHPVTHAVTHTSTKPAPPPATKRPAAPRKGVALPLHYATGSATRVITVVARSTSSTTATLQAWHKAPGGGWLKSGHATTAHVGSDGLSRSPSEYRSATPIGSFTLTRAFGHNTDPGTRLPYFRTTPADWWISQSGSLYNTHQHCSSSCRFTRGDPNEHLFYETPYYNYAVVIDYNTRNAPGGVRQGAGSAFFLHVTDGNPTAGCVAIPQTRLVPIMRWLTPSAHPRILIGVS